MTNIGIFHHMMAKLNIFPFVSTLSQTVEVKCATMEVPWTTTLVPANVHLLTLEALVKIVSFLGSRIDSLIYSFHKQSCHWKINILLLLDSKTSIEICCCVFDNLRCKISLATWLDIAISGSIVIKLGFILQLNAPVLILLIAVNHSLLDLQNTIVKNGGKTFNLWLFL